MPVAIVQLNGLLSKGTDNTYQVSFEGERVKLKTVLSKMRVEISEKAVAFFAINGTKADKDSWVNDGDIIDVFPIVAGG
jgi:molybdopterin converting factor small subunit